MRILRFIAKHAVTQYGSYSKGQIFEATDEFALHLIQLGLAEEAMASNQPARFNKAFTPGDNPEKKAIDPVAGLGPSHTGESRPSGRGITSQSLPEAQAFQSQTSKRSPDRR